MKQQQKTRNNFVPMKLRIDLTESSLNTSNRNLQRLGLTTTKSQQVINQTYLYQAKAQTQNSMNKTQMQHQQPAYQEPSVMSTQAATSRLSTYRNTNNISEQQTSRSPNTQRPSVQQPYELSVNQKMQMLEGSSSHKLFNNIKQKQMLNLSSVRNTAATIGQQVSFSDKKTQLSNSRSNMDLNATQQIGNHNQGLNYYTTKKTYSPRSRAEDLNSSTSMFQSKNRFYVKTPGPLQNDSSQRNAYTNRQLNTSANFLESSTSNPEPIKSLRKLDTSPTYRSQIKFSDESSTKEKLQYKKEILHSMRRQSPFSRRQEMGTLIHDYQMKATKNISDKVNEAKPTKVMEFMKENQYHPYYVTPEHFDFWKQRQQ
eukprot:403356577